MSVSLSDLTIGFIGCGKISSAVCRGYATLETPPKKLLVSLRSREKSAKLASDFPSLVEVIEDSNDIVKRSDVVFVGLLPTVAREELPKLPFHEGNKVIISMMAAVDYAETCSLLGANDGRVEASRIVRTVPLPSAARQSGPILMYPAQSFAERVLSFVGNAVVCQQEQEMKPMISVTGHISSFFELIRTTQDFIVAEGVDSDVARQFVTSFYASLATGAQQSHESLAELRDEAATPGGLNEQSIGFLRSSPHFQLQEESLAAILRRLQGKK